MSQESNEIKIDGYDAKIIKQMINFMYRDVIDYQDVSDAFELLEMAKEYEVHDFQHLFGKSLIGNINLQNVIEYWLKGKTLKNSELMKACGKFINDNFEEFKDSEEFSALVTDDK